MYKYLIETTQTGKRHGIKKNDEMIKQHAIKPIDYHEWYFNYDSVIKVTNICINENVTILGYEGFDPEDGKIISDMNAIFDNSCGEKLSLEEIQMLFFKQVNNAKQKIWTITCSA